MVIKKAETNELKKTEKIDIEKIEDKEAIDVEKEIENREEIDNKEEIKNKEEIRNKGIIDIKEKIEMIDDKERKKDEKENKDKIDWNKLNSINKDIVGWIEIPNTNINYPILQDENLYYLNHNFEGKNNQNGSILIRNENISENKEITIYGHNMKNGTMFAKLANYINKDFFEKNSKIYIYTKENTYEGYIFAAYSKGVNEEKEAIKSLNLAEKIEYYKNESVNLGKIENNVDKLIKLTTCSYINSKTSPTDQRYYVIAEMKRIN